MRKCESIVKYINNNYTYIIVSKMLYSVQLIVQV